MHTVLEKFTHLVEKVVTASYRKEALRQAVALNGKNQDWDVILIDASHFLRFLELGE